MNLIEFLLKKSARASSFDGDTRFFFIRAPHTLRSKAESEEANVLFDRLDEVTEQGFGRRPKGSDGARDQISADGILAVVVYRTQIHGFATMREDVDRSVYLQGIVLTPAVQGRGVGSRLVQTMLEFFAGARFLICLTQSPQTYALIQRFCKKVAPSPQAPTASLELQKKARRFAGQRAWNWDPASLIIRGLYERPLYPVFPKGRDKPVNRWFQETLRVEKKGGTCDAFLLIGKLNM